MSTNRNRLLDQAAMQSLLAKAETKDGAKKRNEADLMEEHFMRMREMREEQAAHEKLALLRELQNIWGMIPEEKHTKFNDLLGMRYAAYAALERGDDELLREYIRRRDDFLKDIPKPVSSGSSSWQKFFTAEEIITAADEELYRGIQTISGPVLSKLLVFGSPSPIPSSDELTHEKSIFKVFANHIKHLDIRPSKIKVETVRPNAAVSSFVPPRHAENKVVPKEKQVDEKGIFSSENKQPAETEEDIQKLVEKLDAEERENQLKSDEALARRLAEGDESKWASPEDDDEAFARQLQEEEERLANEPDHNSMLAEYLHLLELVNLYGEENSWEKRRLDSLERELKERGVNLDEIHGIESGKKIHTKDNKEEDVRSQEYGSAPTRRRG